MGSTKSGSLPRYLLVPGVRLRVELDGVEEKDHGQILLKTKNLLEIENSDKPALIAEALALMIPGRVGAAG
jgi:hypothetical protein